MAAVNCKLTQPFALAMFVAACGAAEPSLTHTDVFVSGRDGYHTYRIPALEAAPGGSLIAFAEARKHNADDPGFGKQDIDLVFRRSTNNGASWSPMTVLEDPGELWSAANPATVVDRTNGRLWVFYLRSRPGCSTDTSRPGTDDMQTRACWSADHGLSWTEPRPGITVTPVMCAIERFTSQAGGDDRGRLLWTGPKGPERRRLVLRTSEDEGKPFTKERLISDDYAAYSDVTLLKDRTVGILWERGVDHGYQFITFTRLNREWLDPRSP